MPKFCLTDSPNSWESLNITRDMMVKEYQNWGEVFKIEFDIKVTKLPTTEQPINVFHITANGNYHQHGDRIPAIWIYRNGDFHISSSINGDLDHWNRFAFDLEKMYQIIIQQFKESDKYWYEIIIDSESKYKTENTQLRSFPNVKFYASDPWYEPFSSDFGCVGNITISK